MLGSGWSSSCGRGFTSAVLYRLSGRESPAGYARDDARIEAVGQGYLRPVALSPRAQSPVQNPLGLPVDIDFSPGVAGGTAGRVSPAGACGDARTPSLDSGIA